MSASYRSVSPSRSTTTSVTAVPAGLVSSLTARAFRSSVTLSCSRAGRTPSTSASDLACSGHGKPSQALHFTQMLYGRFASLTRMPHGAWNGWYPPLARSSDSC